MGTELAIIEPLPVPSLANPTPEWPRWLGSINDALATSIQPDATGERYYSCLTLPKEMMPNETHRSAIAVHRQQLSALLEQRPIDGIQFEKRMFGLIAKLMLAKPSRASGPQASEARQETYDIALNDVPCWAAEKAIRKWHRGECGNDHDYRWAPESADLRKIAMRELASVNIKIMQIDRILRAVPCRHPTDPPRGSQALR
jgi:hypothetical protein